MSTENAASGTSQDSSGTSENKSNDKVAYETYVKAIGEVKKLKDKLKDLESQAQSSNEEKLKEQNKFKDLADIYKKQLDEKNAKLEEQDKAITNGLKYQEFEKHLGGRLKNKDYATFVEFDKIVINPETQMVDESSAKSVVASFVKEHSHLVEFKSGKLPNDAAGSIGTFNGKDPAEMSSAELKEALKKL